MFSIRPRHAFVVSAIAVFLAGCGEPEPIAPERYAKTDTYITQIKENVAGITGLVEVADIDHSRLAHEAGAPMPPARVLIFSDAKLESQLIQSNPLVALDFPLRVLAFESGADQSNQVTYNSFDYLTSRYQLDTSATWSLRNDYAEVMAAALSGIPESARASFQYDAMQPDGIITLDSPFDFEETIKRVNAAIDSQDDTMHFGTIDFQDNARATGIDILPSYMILFGGPGPGGKAMSNAPTLGLDGFCQKFLIWQDQAGRTHLSFNDLLALADRQRVPKALALRVINSRLSKVFEDALAKE